MRQLLSSSWRSPFGQGAILLVKRPILQVQDLHDQAAAGLGAQGVVQGHEAAAQQLKLLAVGFGLLAQQFQLFFQVDPVGEVVVDDLFFDLKL